MFLIGQRKFFLLKPNEVINHIPYVSAIGNDTFNIDVEYTDSKYDTALMRFWLRLGKLHFDMVDSEQRLIENNWTIGKFEN